MKMQFHAAMVGFMLWYWGRLRRLQLCTELQLTGILQEEKTLRHSVTNNSRATWFWGCLPPHKVLCKTTNRAQMEIGSREESKGKKFLALEEPTLRTGKDQVGNGLDWDGLMNS